MNHPDWQLLAEKAALYLYPRRCPFCGAVMGCSEFIYPTGYKVWKLSGYHTYDCVFKVNFYRPENPNKRTLVSAWNRRVNDD